MPGTKIGGQKAAATTKRNNGEDFFKRIGALGGRAGHTGGFWHTKYILGDVGKVREAGARGGLNGTRRGIKNGQAGNPNSRPTPVTDNDLEIFNFHKEAPYYAKKKHWWSR